MYCVTHASCVKHLIGAQKQEGGCCFATVGQRLETPVGESWRAPKPCAENGYHRLHGASHFSSHHPCSLPHMQCACCLARQAQRHLSRHVPWRQPLHGGCESASLSLGHIVRNAHRDNAAVLLQHTYGLYCLCNNAGLCHIHRGKATRVFQCALHPQQKMHPIRFFWGKVWRSYPLTPPFLSSFAPFSHTMFIGPTLPLIMLFRPFVLPVTANTVVVITHRHTALLCTTSWSLYTPIFGVRF